MVRLINKLRFLFFFIILVLFCFFKGIQSQLGLFVNSDIIFGVLLLASLLIISHKEALLVSLIITVVATVAALNLLEFVIDYKAITVVRLLTIIAFLMVMIWACLFYAAQDETISITTLFGPISSYLLIGICFAYIYLLINVLSPNSITGLNPLNESQAVYFSMITLTTVGYGEIVPVKPIAQAFVWLESFGGQVYLAVIIGQLVGRYTAEHMLEK